MFQFKERIFQWREPVGKTLSTIFAGDVCPKLPEAQVRASRCSRELTEEIRPFFASSDLKIMQWETALTDADTPLDKCGPNLKCSPECLNIAKALDIDVTLLANNHTGDFGPDAVLETIAHIEKAGLRHVGAGKNLDDAQKPLSLECGGKKIIFLNYAENEFGNASGQKAGVASLNPFKNIAQIKECRKHADLLFVAIHGGHEHYGYPSPRMVETYRQFADAGADVVWSCHTHCPLGAEVWNGVPIVYSPGNFYFPATYSDLGIWWTGYLAKFHCDDQGAYALEIQPYRFDVDAIHPLNPKEEKQFFEYFETISSVIQDSEKLQRYFEAWCTHSGINYLSCLNKEAEPSWPPDWHSRDVVRRWLPTRNLYTCESHNDLMRQTLRLIEEYRVDEARLLLPEVLALQSPPWMKNADSNQESGK